MLNKCVLLMLTNNVFQKIYTFDLLLFVLFLLAILILLLTFNFIHLSIVNINFKYFLGVIFSLIIFFYL